MFTFGKKAKRRREPVERLRLTDNLVAPVWVQLDSESGTKRLLWSIDRFNPEDESSPFRTLRCKDVLEAPDFIRQLCDVFAGCDFLADSLKKRLANLSLAMAQVTELMERRPNGADDDGSESKRSRALSF